MIRLTDEQWERIRKHFPEEPIPDGRAGRKPIPTRHVLEAVLWILSRIVPIAASRPRKIGDRYAVTCGAGSSSASSPGYNGNVESSSAGSNYAQNFLGFVQLACLVVLFRRF
jgi:hypothetical protein